MSIITPNSLEHLLLKKCENASFAEINAIIDAGADVNSYVPYIDGYEEYYQFGATALCRPIHMAAQNPDIRIIKLLADRGAEVAVENIDGWTPLSYAVISNTKEMFDYLVLQGDHPQREMSDGENFLHLAACNPNKNLLIALLDWGADINGSPWYIPLSRATEAGTIEDMDFLINHGASILNVLKEKINCPACNLRHLLHRGIKDQHIDLHKFFFTKNASIPLWEISEKEDLKQILAELEIFQNKTQNKRNRRR